MNFLKTLKMIVFLEEDCNKKEAPCEVREPVISFVECVKKNRKRFSISQENPVEYEMIYKITDKLTGQQYGVRTLKSGINYTERVIRQSDNLKGISLEELTWACDRLREQYRSYCTRKLARQVKKDKRRELENRHQLTKIYCKEEMK